MSMSDDNIHLLPLDDCTDSDNSSNESEDNNSIEVVSNIDEVENQIVDMTKYLAFSCDEELEINNNNTHSTTLDHTWLKYNFDVSDDDPLEYHPSNVFVTSSPSHLPLVTINTIGLDNNKMRKISKHKHRQWSVSEKLDALVTLKSNGSKHRTAVQDDCTTAQLRKWLKCEDELTDILKNKKGEGKVSSKEKSQYAQGVTVFFTPKRVINGSIMDHYVQIDDSLASRCSMPGYVFDPTSVDSLSLMNGDYDKADRIDIIAQEVSEQ
ncbi:unnamed protein product [Rotaria sordida]|uniref:Uncharacterized protein n=3 Tax=Rotaria sordida TaxID=392033 RepID=A0A815QXQ7_9BILA|nr:unnamed protein product [Rotaria sordida]